MSSVRVPEGTMTKLRAYASATVGQASRKCRVTDEELLEWESGASHPPLDALRSLASLYNVPLSAFLLSSPPVKPPPTIERRTYAGTELPERTVELAAALNRAVAMQEIARDLLEELPGTRFEPVGDVMPPDQLAMEQRRTLGISLAQQLAWDTDYDALNGWRAAVEARGAFVMQYGMRGAHVRAFSIANDPPIIVLNRSDAPRARAFSILHEYGHILLGTAGVCEPGTSRRAMEASEPERYCNLFAGAVMVPSDVLRSDRDARAISEAHDVPSDHEVDRLVRRYQASRGVIWYRLYQTGLVSPAVFNAKWDDWGDYYQPPREAGGGGQTHAEIAVRDFGPRLANLVYLASEAGVLPAGDAAQYLRVPPDALPAVREEAAKRIGGDA